MTHESDMTARGEEWDKLIPMKKSVLIILAVLAGLVCVYVVRAKKAAEAEAELWSEALDPVF